MRVHPRAGEAELTRDACAHRDISHSRVDWIGLLAAAGLHESKAGHHPCRCHSTLSTATLESVLLLYDTLEGRNSCIATPPFQVALLLSCCVFVVWSGSNYPALPLGR
jgi:hypothetical protein